MQVTNQLYPTFEQLAPLSQSGVDEPIVMLNLLRFREQAAYADGRADRVSGREAYLRYAREMKKIVEGNGGRFLFGGRALAVIVGQVEDPWDEVGIVEYPSRADFHRIATSREVQAIGVHREAGLEGQLLILVTRSSLGDLVG